MGFGDHERDALMIPFTCLSLRAWVLICFFLYTHFSFVCLYNAIGSQHTRCHKYPGRPRDGHVDTAYFDETRFSWSDLMGESNL